jgi:CBS domain-containing protein
VCSPTTPIVLEDTLVSRSRRPKEDEMSTRADVAIPTALEDVPVTDVMHRGVVTCPLETPLRTVAHIMATHGIHCVVGVGDSAAGDTSLWGVVSDQDVLAAAASGDLDQEAGTAILTELVKITPDSTLQDAARLMTERELGHLVVAERGTDKPLGVLSTLDIAAAIGGTSTTQTLGRATRVDELMSTSVVTVSPDTSLKHAAALLVEREISGMPVVGSGQVVGVVSEADIIEVERGAAAAPRLRALTVVFGGQVPEPVPSKTVADVMSTPAITVHVWQSAATAAGLMTKHGIKRLPVVENGQLVGIVSRRDLVRAFARNDGAIARDIREHVLAREFWLQPSEVGIQVHEGEVTLTGSVDTELTASMLPTEVRKVPGVVSVDSTIVVRR